MREERDVHNALPCEANDESMQSTEFSSFVHGMSQHNLFQSLSVAIQGMIAPRHGGTAQRTRLLICTSIETFLTVSLLSFISINAAGAARSQSPS
jgi:hypothetical protein